MNLSDGVFAISLTLLVLGLDVPRVAAAELAAALLGEIQQLVVFALGFTLVASIWLVHHRLTALLDALEPGLIVMNFGLLGMVALVPFPTGILGHAPTARAAVIPFIGLFLLMSIMFACMVWRGRRLELWRRPLTSEIYRWLVRGWLGQIAGLLTALAVALWIPVAGLVLAALSGNVSWLVIGWLGPPGFDEWAP